MSDASSLEPSLAGRLPAFDLLVAGDAVPDVIVGDVAGEIAFGQAETIVERGTLTVGGSSAIMACAAARSGSWRRSASASPPSRHSQECTSHVTPPTGAAIGAGVAACAGSAR